MFSVLLRAGQGLLARGTALALSAGKDGTGEMVVPLVTSTRTDPDNDVEETLTANCVLAEPVDTVGNPPLFTASPDRTGNFCAAQPDYRHRIHTHSGRRGGTAQGRYPPQLDAR